MIDEDDDGTEAHSIICDLRTIVGRVLFGSDDEREMECLVQQADAWVAAWRERRLKQETVREALARYGYLDEVMATMQDAFASAPAPKDMASLTEALDRVPTDERGRAMRRIVDAFHRYATLVRETMNRRIDVRDLVQCLLVIEVEDEICHAEGRGKASAGEVWWRRATVTGSRSTMVAEDDALAVTDHQQHTVGGDLVQSVSGALRLRVGAAPTAGQGDRSVTLTVEHGILAVDAAEAIVLRCGSSRIELGRKQMVLTSPRVRVESSAATADHPSAITLEAGGIDVAADDLRQHVGSAQVSANTAIVLGIGPEASEAALALSARGIMASAKGHLDAKADEVCVLGTSSLGLSGKVTGVRGREVAIDADLAIEITSRGPVDIVANDDASTH